MGMGELTAPARRGTVVCLFATPRALALPDTHFKPAPTDHPSPERSHLVISLGPLLFAAVTPSSTAVTLTR